MRIKSIKAREVLDSRGNPTVEAEVTSVKGVVARAIVPSGASTGTREALELRDGDKKRYGGKGVLKAVANVNKKIAPKLKGMTYSSQRAIDKELLKIDGTENKSKLGANAILAVSLAVAKLAAAAKNIPLFEHVAKTFHVTKDMETLPTPMMNIINGGSHADNGIDIQEFMIIPVGAKNMNEAIRYGAEVFHALKKLLANDNYSTAVGDEGGFAPNLKNNEQALKYISKAIEAAGFVPRKDICIAMDVAASEMHDEKTNKYRFDGKLITSQKLLKEYKKMVDKYPAIVSIEDPFGEFDWDTMIEMTRDMGSRIQIVGDDNFVTNKVILKEGIHRGCCNSILIKINQIGTLTETFETIELAKKNGYTTVISHRSGETEDASIADLAVAWNTGQIKTGSLSRTDRVAKYNQLMRIAELKSYKLKYAGSSTIKNFQ